VVLDCPTDNTARIVYERAHRDERIKIIESARNLGPSSMRNLGVSAASGEYIHFMDADDLLNPEFYESLYSTAKACDADVAVAGFRMINESGDCGFKIEFDATLILENFQDKIDFIKFNEYGMAWRYLFKSEFWRRNQFAFPESLRIYEDVVLVTRVMHAANRCVLAPDALYVYKRRNNSLSSDDENDTEKLKKKRKELDRVAQLIRRYSLKT